MLTSSAAETLVGVETVIVDEIHAMAATKRGAHLSLSLERLEEITARPPQRIGLSATQRPLEEVARFLGGFAAPNEPRPVTIVDAGIGKPLEVEVVIPVEDMADLSSGATSGAPPLGEPTGGARPAFEHLAEHLPAHPRPGARAPLDDHLLQRPPPGRATGGQAQRAGRRARHRRRSRTTGEVRDDLVKAHHGSLAREQRIVVEDQLKRGSLRAIVATSSLELGIDMGAVDLVIQVESPGAVSRGLQRIGRAGHQVGEPSRGSIYPKHRGDLLEAAVVVRRMLDGQIESTRYLRNPLDVLAQQLVAHTAARGETPLARPGCARSSIGQLRRAVRRAAGQHARPARRPLPERGVLRAASARGVEPGQRHRSSRATARSGWPSRPAARSPIVGCSACSSPTAPASASSTRRWSTRADRGRRSCSARRRGASRTSRSNGSPSRRRRASPGRCRSGTATGLGGRSELGRALGAFVRELRELPPEQAIDRAARAVRPRRAGRLQPAAVRQRAGRGHGRRSPTTARSSSSASATRSVTGGSASSARSARPCTRRGRWPSSVG